MHLQNIANFTIYTFNSNVISDLYFKSDDKHLNLVCCFQKRKNLKGLPPHICFRTHIKRLEIKK